MTEGPYDVSVVVPVYGGEKTIEPLLVALREVADRQGWKMEVIFVCDRPRDGSWAVAERLAATFADVRSVLLLRNFGQHPATLLGIRMARGAVITTLDEDLQHDPDDLPTLVDIARKTRGVAYGLARRPQHGLLRNVASSISKRAMSWYIGRDLIQETSAFRAFHAPLREAFATYRSERVAIDVLLSWSGAPTTAVWCQHAPRQEGHSGYTLRKLVAYLGDLILGFSTAPLRLASFLGLCAMVVAIGLAVFVFVRWLVDGSAVPGFAFLAILTATLGGVQLLTIGVIGEYLGRMYFNSLGRPQYLVERVVEAEAPEAEGTP